MVANHSLQLDYLVTSKLRLILVVLENSSTILILSFIHSIEYI